MDGMLKNTSHSSHFTHLLALLNRFAAVLEVKWLNARPASGLDPLLFQEAQRNC